MKALGNAARCVATLATAIVLAAHAVAEPLAFVQVAVDNSAEMPLGLAAADMDHDGDMDIVAALFSGGIAWYENNGADTPTFTRRFIAGAAQPRSVVAADVNHDGRVDVVSASDTGVRRHFSDGAVPPVFSTNQLMPTTNAQHIISADVNRDGVLDLVVAGVMPNEVDWFQNSSGAPGTFSRFTLPGAFPMPTAVAAGDLDRDGDLDLVASMQGDNTIVWYQNQGGQNPAFVRNPMPTAGTGLRCVGVGDFDRDGDLDIVACSDSGWGTGLFLNNGAAFPTFTFQQVVAQTAEELQVVDLDQDGDLDILLARLTANEVVWLDNNGASPPVFTTRVLWTGGMPAHAIAAPINRDGKLDIAIALSGANRIVLLRAVRCDGDLNGDGSVNGLDVPLLLGQWGLCP